MHAEPRVLPSPSKGKRDRVARAAARGHVRAELALLLALSALVQPLGVGTARADASPGPGAGGAQATRRSASVSPFECFERNVGQADSNGEFVGRSARYSIGVGSDGMELLALGRARGPTGPALEMRLVGARRVRVAGDRPGRGRSNYLRGRNPSDWRLDVERYGRIVQRGVFPGVDLLYYWSGSDLEYDFVLAPHAVPGAIAFRVPGARRLDVDAAGDLVAERGAHTVRFRRPRAYQWVGGARREVACRYVRRDGETISFDLASWDPRAPLVIDPVLTYASYLGGPSDLEDARAVAVDADGRVVVCGTALTGFPVTPDAIRGAADETEAFVARITSDGTELEYATFVGGSGTEFGRSVALGADGEIYLAGQTASSDFPVTPGAFQPQLTGPTSAFVTRLSGDGRSMLSSTLLAGPGGAGAHSLAVDRDGNVVVAGDAGADFPTTPGAFRSPEGSGDSFAARLNSSLSKLLTSAFLGGCRASAVAVDADANAYVVGHTASARLPATPAAYQPEHAGGFDAFVLKLAPEDASAVFATYVGGPGTDLAFDVAVDAVGAAYVVGQAQKGFPGTPGAYRSRVRGVHDAFVAKLDATGEALVYSTLVGSRTDRGGICPEVCLFEAALGVVVDAGGNAFVVGAADPVDFPAVHPLQVGHSSGNAFVAKVDALGRSLLFASLVGGRFSDVATDVARGEAGDVYVVGTTASDDFPVTLTAFESVRPGGLDGFVLKLGAPVVEAVTIEGSRLVVRGDNFDGGATVLIDGRSYRTEAVPGAPGAAVASRKALRRMAPGASVSVEVRNSDGTTSRPVSYTRPG